MKDHLQGLQPTEVAAWYGRLANMIDQENKSIKDALAPLFLRHYLKGKGKKLIFSAPDHLKNSNYVVDVLKDHRSWYLTEKRFKNKWVGIIPRLQGKHPTDKWAPVDYLPRVLELRSLVEIDVKWFTDHTPGDNDLMTSLRGFQLCTQCHFFLSNISGKNIKVAFIFFFASVIDRYDFDPDEYFPVPNPDYKNPLKLAKPVAPDQEKIFVFHRNAIRMEKAGLAQPFDLQSKPWITGDLMQPAEIDPAKNLSRPF
jgi:hypothetical protein